MSFIQRSILGLLCLLAQSVLLLLFAFPPMCPVILSRHVLFGFNSGELRVTHRNFVYLLNLLKFLIWHPQNDFRFRSIHPGAVKVIVKAKVHARFNIPLFFKCFKSLCHRHYFHRQWGAHGVVASGVVASVVDGRLLDNI